MEKYVRQNARVFTKVIPIIETKKTQVGFQILHEYRTISLRNTTLIVDLNSRKTVTVLRFGLFLKISV